MDRVASLFCRPLLHCCIAIAGGTALIAALAFERFEIPSGSMAPTLHGRHRVCTCPGCGRSVAVGRALTDAAGTGEPRHYRKAFCANCGTMPLPVESSPERAGDQVLIDKTAFLRRQPARWEIIVFRLLGTFYIKRVLGLPDETVLIHDGDAYVNGQLAHKTYAQARSMRVPVFDHDNTPPEGWTHRWGRAILALDGRDGTDELVYANISSPGSKCEPIRDEYDYSGGLHARSECVHDFLIETDLEIGAGHGSLTLWLDDGADRAEIELPPMRGRHHVEMAFVDRRLSLVIDGRLITSKDWPEAKTRAGVERPFGIRASGVAASLHGFRLDRDVHYGQQGQHGVRGKSVQLGVDQYFVLGDNSPCSRDSRFWTERVTTADLIGSLVR